MEKSRVIHVVTSLENGGAQEVLKNLCLNTANSFTHEIICLNSLNAYKDDLSPLSAAKMLDVGCSGFSRLIGELVTLAFLVRESQRPVVIQGWLYHGNLLALFLKLISPATPILLSIHNGSDQRVFTSLSGYITSRICALFSGLAKFTVFVSHKAMACHVPYRHAVVIPNPLKPLQTINLVPVESNSDDFDPRIVNLVCVARFDPIKNIGFLLDIIQALKSKNLKVCLRMAGEGMAIDNETLVEMIRVHNLQDTVELLGVLTEVSSVYAWADYTVLTSHCESFSNVLLESIASGTPFISSDVGIAENLLSMDSLVIKGFELSDWVEAMEQKLQARKTHEVSSNVREFYQKVSGVYAPERIAALYSDCWSKALGR